MARWGGGGIRTGLAAVCVLVLTLAATAPRVRASGETEQDDPATDSAPTVAGGSDRDGATDTVFAPPEEDEPDVVVGAVTVRVGNVFDTEAPGENRRLFRLANRLHFRTRERAIRKRLLFESGDRCSQRLLDESERRLRDEPYLYDAKITTVPVDDGTVDVVVDTRDVWSLRAGVGFKRSGGRNQTHFGLEDRNFLGLGKDVAVRQSIGVDRTSTLLRYGDRSLFGTRAQLGLEYTDSSDGFTHELGLERPFFSLDSRWAMGVRYMDDERVESIYDLGDARERFGHQRRLVEVYAGSSRGLRGSHVSRWTGGFTYRRDGYGAPGVDTAPDGFEDSTRVLSYPWVEYQAIRDGYVTTRDLDKMSRTEDLNLGHTFRVRLGLASTSLGADRNRMITEMTFGTGRPVGARGLLLLTGHAGGRFARGGGENVLAGGRLRYYLRGANGNLFVTELEGDVVGNPDPETQLLLGGDSGLRGYPFRYLAGDRRLLLTVEKRYFTNWYPLRLFHVGAAVFADAGRVWGGDYTASPAGARLPKDIGVGLRFGSSRSADASMVHVDLAMPLDGGDSISNLQFLITSKSAF